MSFPRFYLMATLGGERSTYFVGVKVFIAETRQYKLFSECFKPVFGSPFCWPRGSPLGPTH